MKKNSKENFSNWSLTDLERARDIILKNIKSWESFLEADKDCYFKNGELYKIHFFKEQKLSEIKDGETNERLYSDELIERMKPNIEMLNYLRERRNILNNEIIKKCLGEKFFKIEEKIKNISLRQRIKDYAIKNSFVKHKTVPIVKRNKLQKFLLDEGYTWKGDTIARTLRDFGYHKSSDKYLDERDFDYRELPDNYLDE